MKKINFITETYQLLEDDAYCIDIVKDINRFSVYLPTSHHSTSRKRDYL